MGHDVVQLVREARPFVADGGACQFAARRLGGAHLERAAPVVRSTTTGSPAQREVSRFPDLSKQCSKLNATQRFGNTTLCGVAIAATAAGTTTIDDCRIEPHG